MEPIHYRLILEPDLDNFSFEGHVEIRFDSPPDARQILLNCLELSIFTCRMKLENQWTPCSFELDAGKETLQIDLPRAMSGRIELSIDYSGSINDKMAGFYRSAYTSNGRTRYIGVTQFEESDARRALPCMDHPLHKAVFDIEIVVDRQLSVISNEAIAEERDLGNGKKSVRFFKTPKMSTYLLFFGVGEFETRKDPDDERVIGAALPGRIDQLAFGVAFGRKALHYCEDYFGIAYPLSKMHLIAVPDFAFGAMENWGAITFRENLLLFYPEVTSRAGAQRICEVIAHEIAHQWFGNLVTPSDWKYLWLNESFATYFGFSVVDHYYPQWGTWDQFLLGQTETAMSRDALQATFPIEIPGGEHVVINASTAPIIYSKGGSLLRQIHGYIGREHFQKGLRRYLEAHQYDCARSHHLWEAFEAVSDRPVTHMVRRWVEQPGFPLVEARRTGNTLTLSQRPFTYLPTAAQRLWPIPVVLQAFDKTGASRQQVVLLENRSQTFELPAETAAVKINAGQTGFYRVYYPEDDARKALGHLVETKALAPEDRWGLQNDMFSLVRAGIMSFAAYTAFLDFYAKEDAFLPLSSIDDHLFLAFLVLDETWRERIAAMGRALADRTLARIGYAPAADEPQTLSMLREQLLWHAILYGHHGALEFAAKEFRKLMKGGSVHPDISKSILQAGALLGDKAVLEWLYRRLESTTSEHERMNILTALGCLGEPALITAAAQYTLDSVPARNKFIPIVAMAANPRALPYLWRWYTDHVADLETFHPLLYERVIAAIVPIAGMNDPDGVRTFFKTYLQQKALAAEIIHLSLEKLEINLTWSKL